MAMKITAGVGRKIGQPEFSSISASCHVEFEADQSLLNDQSGFQQRVRAAFTACRDAVAEELARHQALASSNDANGSQGRADTPTGSAAAPRTGNGRPNGNGHRISEKQLTFIRQLAGSIKGLGVRRLDAIANKMFGGKALADLSSLDGSSLIDTLKSIKEGKINLDSVLEGTTP